MRSDRPSMAGVTIDSGEVPSAKGLKDGELDRCVGRWARIASSNFCNNAKPLLQIIDQVDELRLWETFWDGMYKTREEFLRRKVLIDFDVIEHELPVIIDRLRRGEKVRLTPKAAVEVAPKQVGPGQGKRTDKEPRVDNTKLIRGSTNVAYLAARLKRDHPEIVARIGEFKSIRAAAIEAGIVKPTWTAPVDPVKLAEAIERRYAGVLRVVLVEAA